MTESEARRAMFVIEPPIDGILQKTNEILANWRLRNFAGQEGKIVGCTGHLLWFRPGGNGALELCAPLKFFKFDQIRYDKPSSQPDLPRVTPLVVKLRKELRAHPVLKKYAGKQAQIMGYVAHRTPLFVFLAEDCQKEMMGPCGSGCSCPDFGYFDPMPPIPA